MYFATMKKFALALGVLFLFQNAHATDCHTLMANVLQENGNAQRDLGVALALDQIAGSNLLKDSNAALSMKQTANDLRKEQNSAQAASDRAWSEFDQNCAIIDKASAH